jgi:N-acylglucosamine 2-epimerase
MLSNNATSEAAQSLKSYSLQYKTELLDSILPFWMKHSVDQQNGGFFTCLDQFGQVYDTDKFIWLQGRQVWCFAYMYNNIEKKQEWLDIAKHGADFLIKHGRDEEGNWYFSLTAEGKPLVQPYNIFSDCFATMAFAALDKASPSDEYKKIALTTFDNIIARRQNTKGKYNKNFPGTRSLKNFSLPMILCNLSLELEHIIGKEKVNELVPDIIHEVMEVFYQPKLGLVLENVNIDGSFADCFEGRLMNPGHTIEAMWFIMDLGIRVNDTSLIDKAVTIMLNTLEYGWDKEYGGIFYFLDIQGHPPQQLEWDQKLWWVHVEALVALAKGFQHTGDMRCKEWFEKVHAYTWTHFKDQQYGEWFGYLNRRGEVLLPLKGGKWKGCFHIPRSLYQVWKTLETL